MLLTPPGGVGCTLSAPCRAIAIDQYALDWVDELGLGRKEWGRRARLRTMNKLGRELFDQIYEQLSLEIQQDTPAEERAQSIRDICEGSEDLIKLCQKLEEIIFIE